MPSDGQLPATSLVPELAAFRADLEELGYVVVPHGDHLCVRLPQFASVAIKDKGKASRPPKIRELLSHTAGFAGNDVRTAEGP